MENKKRNKAIIIWISAIVLLILACATTLLFIERSKNYLPNDSGAISLVPENPSQSEQITTENDYNPSFQIYDSQKVWGTNTAVEIFKVSYVNGEKEIKIKSDNDDNVIAPGSGSSYTFKLKNNDTAAVDYNLTFSAEFSNSDIQIPITAKISRYDGKWLIGNNEKYENVMLLNQTTDSATVGAGKYTYYTLEWEWPYENDNDYLDTMLGNMSLDQELTFVLKINTTATLSDNPNADGGIDSPQTSDNVELVIVFMIAFSIFALILFIIFFLDNEKQRKKTEEEIETV